MKLMTVKRYIDTHFEEGSKPTLRTVYRWINDGVLPAERIGKQYYVKVASVPVKVAEILHEASTR